MKDHKRIEEHLGRKLTLIEKGSFKLFDLMEEHKEKKIKKIVNYLDEILSRGKSTSSKIDFLDYEKILVDKQSKKYFDIAKKMFNYPLYISPFVEGSLLLASILEDSGPELFIKGSYGFLGVLLGSWVLGGYYLKKSIEYEMKSEMINEILKEENKKWITKKHF